MSSALLQTRRLEVRRGERVFCRELNIQIQPGSSWGLLGMNGSGKTTLLHSLAGLYAPQQGEILFEAQALAQINRKALARRLGLLLQSASEAFPGTVLQTVLTGRHPHLGAWQWESPQDYALARAALAAVDLQNFEQRDIQTLSGGEQRRMYIATLLAQQTRLMLLDEPVNHLDLHHQHHILQLLRQLCREQQRAMFMVLHDPNLALRYCDQVLLLYPDGDHAAGPAADLLNAANLSRLYGHPIRELRFEEQRVFVAG